MLSTKLFNNNGFSLSLCILKRFSHQTHYDVLKLKRDCTKKDIRNAFIALSKQYHPDKQDGKDTDKKFVKILEAYKVLIQPSTRAEYDLGLCRNVNVNVNTEIRYYRTPNPYVDPVAKAWADPSFYKNRNKADDEYYAKNKTNNLPYICLSFVSLAVFIYSFTLWRIYEMHEERQRQIHKNRSNYDLFFSSHNDK